jgi:hypothetical protein
MITKKLLTTIAFAFVLLLSGCAKDDFDQIDGVCPLVVSTVPVDGAIDIPLNQIITATFNEKMNPATITETSFTISANGALIDGTVSYNGLTATFDPIDALEPDTEYTGTITTMAKDQRGNALQENYVWTFTTLPEFVVTITTDPTTGPITTGAGVYLKGTAVTVTAAVYANYTFTNWTTVDGVIVSNDPTYILPPLMDNVSLVANYSLVAYEISLLASPPAGGTPEGAGFYNFGSTAIVTANPAIGYNFVNWTENGDIITGEGATYSFTVSGARTLQANYVLKTYTLDVTIIGSGTVTKDPVNGPYNHGSTVTLTAQAATDFEFTGWSGPDGTGIISTLPVTMDGNKNITATFTAVIPQFTINTSALPTAGGTTTGAGSLTGVNLFDEGTSVTVNAVPSTEYTFVNWTDDNGTQVSIEANYEFPLNENTILVANFVINTYTLRVTAVNGNVSINGNVLANPFQATYNYGDEVILTPTPINSNYEFLNWTGDATGNDNPLTVTMDADKNITANFILIVAIAECPSPAVDLGLAGNYAILAESAISTTGVTSVTGDMGISPLAATFITGFGLTLHSSGTYSTSSLVTGRIYAADYTAPTPSNLTTTVDNMHTAFTTANGLAPDSTEYLAGNLNNVTLPAGVYKYGTGLLLSNTITLDGGNVDCAAFVFQIAGDLTVANNVKIVLINGAKADNIFWVTAGAGAVIGSDVDFSGNVLSKTLISLEARSTVKGRLLAQTEVTLIGNSVVKPSN